MRIARSEADHFMKWPGFGEWFDISGRPRSKYRGSRGDLPSDAIGCWPHDDLRGLRARL
jgi:hypothetical protein